MFDLFTSSTPNGWKASVALEEMQLPYEVHSINLMEQEQKTPAFLARNPNGRIPVLVDKDEDPSFESSDNSSQSEGASEYKSLNWG